MLVRKRERETLQLEMPSSLNPAAAVSPIHLW